jgi:uncharacterized protein
MNTKKIYIKGMHCVSCEKLLEDELKNVAGVLAVRANRKTNSVEIEYGAKEPNFSELKKMAEKFGYQVFENAPGLENKKTDWSVWIKSIVIVAVILFLFRIFQSSGIVDGINLKSSNVTFGIAILIGLVASVSSCLAVVGAVIIAFGEKYQTGAKSFYAGAIKPNLYFHIGRLTTFFVLGGLLGLIGGEVNISGNFISVFTIIVALVMGWLGLNILGFVPSIANSGIRMPKGLTGKWDNLKRSEHQAAPFILGGLSFFLPCGFTRSMQIFALTSGSFWVGGLSLFLFALGTVPALMALGVTVSWTSSKKMVVFQKVAGFLIVFFAIYTLQSGFALSGVKTNVLTSEKEAVSSNAVDNNADKNAQEIVMHVTSSGFSPATLTIKKGVPVRWVIKGDAVTGCTSKIIVPSLNISRNISQDDTIIEFTPTVTGEIPFSCWMGMVRGKFIIE